MKARLFLAAFGSAAAALGLTLASAQFREARALQRALTVAQHERETLPQEIAAWEDKVRHAEQRAREAERDTAELLKAVEAVRTQRAAATVAEPPSRSTPMQGTVASPNAQLTEEEKQRLAQERAYQQDLATTRMREAMARSQFDEEMLTRGPAEKFSTWFERARLLAERGEFQAAVRAYHEAMAAKPAELPVPEEASQLQRRLAEQSSPVEVTFTSDGATFVSISNYQPPQRFAATKMKLLPGNYEVVGRRSGFRAVRMPLQVRAGPPPPTISIVCAVPAEP